LSFLILPCSTCAVISAAYGKQVSQFSQTCVLCFSSVSAKQNLFLCCSQPLWCLSMVKDYLVRRNCHMLDHFLFPLICFGLWLPTSLVGCRFFLSSSQTSFICLTNNQQHSTPFTFEFNKCMHFFFNYNGVLKSNIIFMWKLLDN
jgi:hypothetical protein